MDSVKKVGLLDIEPLFQPLQSGVELFEESELRVSSSEAKKHVITNRQRTRMIAREIKSGNPTLIDVYWGEDFDQL